MASGDNRSPWMRTKIQDGSSYYFHLQKLEGTWDRPQGFVQNSMFLAHDEMQVTLSQLPGPVSSSTCLLLGSLMKHYCHVEDGPRENKNDGNLCMSFLFNTYI